MNLYILSDLFNLCTRMCNGSHISPPALSETLGLPLFPIILQITSSFIIVPLLTVTYRSRYTLQLSLIDLSLDACFAQERLAENGYFLAQATDMSRIPYKTWYR